MTRHGLIALFAAAACLLAPLPAHAIRPFVTDDARVVGGKLSQLETWVLVDRLALEHNVLTALGPTEWLELTLGLMHGGVHSGPHRGYSITGPLLQVKALLLPARDDSWPGIALSVGAFPPFGTGELAPPGWQGFAYAAVTESLFDEGLLIHANLGFAFGDQRTADDRPDWLVTGGTGAQIRVVGGFHAVAEIYYGDPFDVQTGFPAGQVGFRYIFSDTVQIDGTFGTTLTDVVAADERSGVEQWGLLVCAS